MVGSLKAMCKNFYVNIVKYNDIITLLSGLFLRIFKEVINI